MAKLLISPLRLRMIFLLHYEGRGTMYISMTTGISRNIVQKILQRLRQSGNFTEEDIEKMNDQQLSAIFLP